MAAPTMVMLSAWVGGGEAGLAQVAPGPAPQVPRERIQALPTRQQVDVAAPGETPARRPVVTVNRLPEPGPCPLTGEAPVAITRVALVPARGGALPAPIAALLAPIATAPSGPQTLRTICDIRDAANRALYDAGYVSSVQIPPQEISGGVLTLNIVTGRIVETRVTGYDGKLRASVAARIEAIRNIDPLNRKEIERRLLLASDVPGLSFSLTLQPAGREPGDVIAIIAVQQRHALVLANYQNGGSRALGRGLFSGRVNLYDLTGLADETYLGVSQSAQWDEVHSVQGGHSIGIGTGGVRAGLRGSYAWSNPTIPGINLRSRSIIAGFDLSAPLWRGIVRTGSRANDINAYVGAGLELLNQRSIIRSDGVDQPYTRDRLRVAYGRIGARLISRDAYGLARYDSDVLVELRKGMSILNATPRGPGTGGYQPSRVSGDPEAFEVRGSWNQTIRPFGKLSWFALDSAFYGQWSNRPLLNLEEFSLGNLTIGRGYDPGANAGDRALALRVGPRFRLTPAGAEAQIEMVGFYDAVRIWNLDADRSEARRTVKSYGGGVRMALADRFAMELVYARPLDRPLSISTSRPTDRVLLTLTTQLLPWRFGR